MSRTRSRFRRTDSPCVLAGWNRVWPAGCDACGASERISVIGASYHKVSAMDGTSARPGWETRHVASRPRTWCTMGSTTPAS